VRVKGLIGSLLVATAFLVPFNVERIFADYGRYSDVHHRISLYLVHVPLAVLALAAILALPWDEAVRRLRGAVWILVVLGGLALVSLAFHPSSRGVQTVLRLTAGVGIPALAIPFLDRTWARRVVTALLAGVAFQAGLSFLQVATGDTVGLTFLGENPPLYPGGTQVVAKGTFVGPHSLAAFAAVALGVAVWRYLRRPSLGAGLGVAASAVPLALSYTRTGALAALGVAAAVVLRQGWPRKRAVLAAAAVAVGIAVPALVAGGGWLQRLEESTDFSRGFAGVTSERSTFTRQAFSLIGQEPLVGVGPGRYVLELESQLQPPAGTETLPVHNVPLMVTAELGIAAGVVVTAGLALLGWHAWRRDRRLLVLYLAYLPFLMLDVLPYDTGQGIALTGLWVGLILREIIRPAESEKVVVEPAYVGDKARAREGP
jgi:O-antigen ligase